MSLRKGVHSGHSKIQDPRPVHDARVTLPAGRWPIVCRGRLPLNATIDLELYVIQGNLCSFGRLVV
jgi:hypothetical protein